MFEANTYDAILQRMLAQMPAGFDKREGSVLYNAAAPMAAELAQSYVELDVILQEVFADTASREFLLRRAAERGLTPHPATHAVLKGIMDTPVPVGSRYYQGTLTYRIIKKVTDSEYQLECETEGEIGNTKFGTLIPVEYQDGLTSAELTELLIPGTEEEETEHFRSRYFASFTSQAYGGNRADYLEKVGAIPGVGGVKIRRRAEGQTEIPIILMDSTFGVPSNELLQTVQELIDPPGTAGEGDGLAPIGHRVEVTGVESFPVEVAVTLTTELGISPDSLTETVNQTVDAYFLRLAKSWADTTQLVVRLVHLESELVRIPGIVDVSGTMFNGTAENLILGEYQIPTRKGEVHVT